MRKHILYIVEGWIIFEELAIGEVVSMEVGYSCVRRSNLDPSKLGVHNIFGASDS